MLSKVQVSVDEILARLSPPEIRAELSDADLTDAKGIEFRLCRLVVETQWRRRIDGSPIQGHFAVIDQVSPTAFSIEVSSEHFLIAIHSGLLKVLMNVFGRMAHHPAIWGESIQSNKHIRHDLFESTPFSSSQEGPMLLATLLYRLTIEFLFYHELHHVLLGHVGFVRRVRHGARMVESEATSDVSEVHQRSMEYIADLFASKTLCDSIKRRRFSLLTPQSLDGLADHHLMYAGTLAFLTLFCTFQLYDRSEHAAYPPLNVRTLTFVDYWTRASQGGESMKRDLWDRVASTAIRTVQTVFSELYDDVALLSFGDDEEAIDHAYEGLTELAAVAQSHISLWQPFAIKADRVAPAFSEVDGSQTA